MRGRVEDQHASGLFRHPQRFETKAALTKAALHTELFDRLRNRQAQQRWTAVREQIDKKFPQRSETDRVIAAANIRFYLSATAWHYFRFYFGFGLDETVACASAAVQQILTSLRGKRSKS